MDGSGQENMKRARPKSIDAYIAGLPGDVQERLKKIRATIAKAAAKADEKISYRIPTFALKGNLVSFAAFTNHIGFYPGAAAIKRFAKQVAAYETSKGTVRFPSDKPIPFALIAKIVKFRVTENLARAAAKGKKK